MTDPRTMRVQVKGDILSLKKPASAWLDDFEAIEPFPVCTRSATGLLRYLPTNSVISLFAERPALPGSPQQRSYGLTRTSARKEGEPLTQY